MWKLSGSSSQRKYYLVGPPELRIANVRANRHCSESEAKRYIRETDEGRRELVEKYFNRDIGDPHHYDLVINRAHIDLDAAAELTASEWRRRFRD